MIRRILNINYTDPVKNEEALRYAAPTIHCRREAIKVPRTSTAHGRKASNFAQHIKKEILSDQLRLEYRPERNYR